MCTRIVHPVGEPSVVQGPLTHWKYYLVCSFYDGKRDSVMLQMLLDCNSHQI